MTRLACLPILLTLACAHQPAEQAAERPVDLITTQRIYSVAEEHYAAGEYDEAIALMRHALLQLPTTPEHDRLRHQLLLRMAHTQLQSFTASGNTAQLVDAQQMLTRYAERHEALFGESEAARAERGEVFELLYEVERRLDPTTAPVYEPAPAAEPIEVAQADAVDVADPSAVPEAPADYAAYVDDDAPVDYDDPAAAVEPIAVEPIAVEPIAEPQPARHPHADGESIDQVRELLVHERRLASLDDPRVRERLSSDFSTAWSDLILTAPGISEIHGPRPLVRGTSHLAGSGSWHEQRLAHRAGQSLLRDARPSLRSCYADAFTRETIPVLESTVEASIHPDGSISHVRFVDGGLIDGRGDACVIEAMQDTIIEPLPEAEEPVRVQVALVFFYEGAVYINEATGEQVHEGQTMVTPSPPRTPGLPPIDRFTK